MVNPKTVPAPRGLEHLGAMRLAGQDINGAVTTLHERYGPVFAFGFGPLHFVWLVGPEAVRFVTLEAASGLALGPAYRFLRPIVGNAALITSDEPEHLRRRRVVQPNFHKERLGEAFRVVEGRLRALFASLSRKGGPVDLYAALRPCVLETICEVFLGAETLTRNPELTVYVAQMMAFANLPFALQELKVPLPGTPWARFVRARRHSDRLLFEEIRQRRADGAKAAGVMSLLLAATDEGGAGLSDKEVRDQALSLVSAGFETTSAALTWAVYALLEQPDVFARLREELAELATLEFSALSRLPYLERVVKETLRLYPPAPAALRVATQDLTFAGLTIPKGQRLALSVYATHRQAASYPDPLRFDPDRWLGAVPANAYLPFGNGARYCIGAGLATGVVKFGLALLLRDYRLSPAWMGPVQEAGNTLHPKGGLPVRLERKTA